MNKIIKNNDYSILLIKSPKYGELKVLIDTEDIPFVKDIHWVAERDIRGKFYIRNRHKNLRLHRLVTNCPDGLVIDHLNHNTLDNRKSNLKICTISENNKNTNPENKFPNKTTGIYGISTKNQTWTNKDGTIKHSTCYVVQYKKYPRKCFKTLREAKIYLEECRKDFLKDNYVCRL